MVFIKKDILKKVIALSKQETVLVDDINNCFENKNGVELKNNQVKIIFEGTDKKFEELLKKGLVK